MNMERENTNAIFTPVFDGTNYKHHQCSECGAKLNFEQTPWGGVSFYGCENIRFCPNCGKPIVRFSKQPIFEQQIDWSPLDSFIDLRLEYEEKVKWYFFCKLTDAERIAVRKIIGLRESAWGIKKTVIDNIQEADRYMPSWQTIRKLERRFEFQGG